MGWPAGVELLLEKSSSTELPAYYHVGREITDEDSEIDQYAKSCHLLFEAEYTFSIHDTFRTESSKLKTLFLSEMAKRRKRLLEIANAHIHPSELSEIRKGETGLPDTQAYRLCAALMAKGIKVDRFLRPIEGESVYSELVEGSKGDCFLRLILGESVYSKLKHASFNILKKAYEFGFTDVDQQLPGGYTLLSTHCSSSELPNYQLELIGWLISKGADPLQRLPRSTTTVTHLISANMGKYIYFDFRWANNPDPNPFHQIVDRTPLHQIVDHLLSVRVTDACSCPCSVGGCTTLSVAIRHVIALYDRPWALQDIALKGPAFRKFLQHLIEYNRSDSQPCRSIIRSLTFDGLGLSHSCCTEIDHWAFGLELFRLGGRDQCDLSEIMEEQRDQFKHFESLMAEFEYQFDAYGLPLMDFLQEVWYERMIRYLSHRDPFDAEHHQELRKLDVVLEIDDVEIPLVVQLICDYKRVTAVEDDYDDSRSGHLSSS